MQITFNTKLVAASTNETNMLSMGSSLSIWQFNHRLDSTSFHRHPKHIHFQIRVIVHVVWVDFRQQLHRKSLATTLLYRTKICNLNSHTIPSSSCNSNKKKRNKFKSTLHENCVRKCISEKNFFARIPQQRKKKASPRHQVLWIFILRARLHHAQCAIYVVIKMPFRYSFRAGVLAALHFCLVKRKIGDGWQQLKWLTAVMINLSGDWWMQKRVGWVAKRTCIRETIFCAIVQHIVWKFNTVECQWWISSH